MVGTRGQGHFARRGLSRTAVYLRQQQPTLNGTLVLNRLRSLITRTQGTRGSSRLGSPSQSIFELIAAEVSRNPTAPLDESLFPTIRLDGDGELSYAPGAVDAVIAVSSTNDKDREVVKSIVSRIERGKIREWKGVEEALRGVRAIGCVDAVIQDLKRTRISSKAIQFLWTTAKFSSDYEVIKWGIALGSLGENDEEKVRDLVMFARHPEFTIYSGYAIRRMAAAKPELKRYLVELLPFSHQWGVINLIQQIVGENDLIREHEVQRKVLIYGMENNGGIPMEVAFIIAANIELSRFVRLAETDTQVYVALSKLIDTLITQPNPLGGIDQLVDGDVLLAEYLEMLTKRPTDIRMLAGLDILKEHLAAHEPVKEENAGLLSKVERLWAERFDDNVLRAGLRNADTRWLTLDLIGKLKIGSVLPEVREAFQREPDYSSISVLAELGNNEDLQMLFAAIPRLVDLKDRANRKISAVNVRGPESKGAFEYGRIVEALGRFVTPDAIAHLKVAASDYDPMIRQSACKAFARIPLDKVDEDIARIIHERLNDPMAYVREAAKEASSKLVV